MEQENARAPHKRRASGVRTRAACCTDRPTSTLAHANSSAKKMELRCARTAQKRAPPCRHFVSLSLAADCDDGGRHDLRRCPARAGHHFDTVHVPENSDHKTGALAPGRLRASSIKYERGSKATVRALNRCNNNQRRLSRAS